MQSVDVLAPLVNDPYRFGAIAAANALSDIYAMGGEPWCAMNLAFFPSACLDTAILREMLRGGLDKLHEAGCVSAGGHSVEDGEIKLGYAVTGVVESGTVAANDGLRPGDVLLLTKALGTGITATAVKARWEGWEESEEALWRQCSRLNSVGAKVIRELGLKAATDVTGFGLGGHLLETARASGCAVRIELERLPLMPRALDYARSGLIPAASHANRLFCRPWTACRRKPDEALEALLFDAQSSGGLVLAVPEEKRAEAGALLKAGGEPCWEIGRVEAPDSPGIFLIVE